jgi:hypothetical protein
MEAKQRSRTPRLKAWGRLQAVVGSGYPGASPWYNTTGVSIYSMGKILPALQE